jgi:hypothetical protein
MTTLAQIKKIAKTEFIPAMEKHGFQESSKASMKFYRESKDGIFHIISFNVLRSGELLRIHVYSWVIEFEDEFNMDKFPKYTSILNGDCLGESRIGIEDKLWEIMDLENIPTVLAEILDRVNKIALPWLDGITNREELINRTLVDFRKNNPYFEEIKERVLSSSR